ncbi:MAG: MBL fold metallo-hydrolase [Defluviitaleaceae bacterium]|nr:MBL fold metallo-hydrolase [Defluviitaleaceae bacterium]
MGYYATKKIYPWLWAIHDPMDTYMYLVVGNNMALLYDTGYGIMPIEPAVREITDLPVTVVLGHGHLDHANGAYQFEEAWIGADDYELCLRHASRTGRRRVLERLATPPEGFDAETYIHRGAGNLKKLEDGQVFDLGGLTAEVVPMEGHTQGSVGILVREKGVLLNSDAANTCTWVFLAESTSIADYAAMLERVGTLPFDTFFIGHDTRPFAKEEYFKKFISVAKSICVEKSRPFDRLPEREGRIYREGNVAVIFSRDKL